jgi:membrane-associated phospholipid phosphatase
VLGNIILFIFFFLSIYLLFDKTRLLFLFIICYFLNIIINLILKGLIQQPRPNEDHRLFNLELLNIQRSKTKEYMISYNRYGMPSQHAQLAFYSTIYIYFALKNNIWTIFYSLLALFTLYQRVLYNYHTLFQVIVGSIIGGVFSFLLHYYHQF